MTYASASNNQWLTYTNIVEAVNNNDINLKYGQTVSNSNRWINKDYLITKLLVDQNNTFLLSKTQSNQFIAKQDITPILCVCPTGYTRNYDNTLCVKVTTVPADLVGSVTSLSHYSLIQYSVWGAIIYPIGSYGTNGAINQKVNTVLVSDTSPLYGYKPIGEASVINSLWSCLVDPEHDPPNDVIFQDGTYGRLNRTGVWKFGDQGYGNVSTPIGFSRNFAIPTSGNYLIGVGSDNYCTIKINGAIVIQQDITSINNSFNDIYGDIISGNADLFRYWHIYEVFLNAGQNIISLIGTNLGSYGIIGCEIYNATPAQLASCSNETQLSPYIIFSSAARPFGSIDDGYSSDLGYYDCSSHPGYTLSYDPNTSSYYCTLVETTSCNVLT